MDDIRVTVGRGGEITLPPDVLAKLRLKPGDEVSLDIKDIGVRLRKTHLTLADIGGSLTPRHPVTDIDEAIRQAKDEKVRSDARKLADQELRAAKPAPEY
jgi:bifunctional DNA-binding transcriptional regulator/antitoxin component of YhaV-PrlF toxin-antitoxin module